MTAHLHPLDAGSDAQRDGRAHRTPLPDAYRWIVLTQNVNAFLGTHYNIEEVRAMDAVQLSLIETYLAVSANPDLADELWTPGA